MLKRKVLFTVLVVAVAAAAILVYATTERRMGPPEAEQRLLPRTWATRYPRGFLCAHIVRVRKVVYH